MSDRQVAPASISVEDWVATPPAVRTLVVSLLATVEAQQNRIAELEQSVAQLQARLAELEERVRQNSRNSSKPPSSDAPTAPPRPKQPASGRKVGGQPGHPGKGRSLQPVESVNWVVPLRPVRCATCGALLLGEDPHPVRHQVTELPRIEPEVIEYQHHTLTCLACGAPTRASWPAEMPTGSFGPRTQAAVGYFTGRLGVSQRDVAEMLETVFHTDLGLGSIPALEQDVSAAVASPVAEAQACVQTPPVNNVDETSWPERAQRGWLWLTTTPLVTVFRLLATRSAEGAKKLLGETFLGIVGSDRWSAYNWLDPTRRQLCWAHLKRDFQAFVERGVKPNGSAGRCWNVSSRCLACGIGYEMAPRPGLISRPP
jgi:transposase